ncbi:MAG: hypothetical protein CME63_04650 [Halobacteriovoraceae bacterium]|jgi:hypothetical protein|nr:hypothetical protein [Halobacteriovoraceae bacterium]|tara:strand:- start:34507 stop:34941 length:435 start_codon:yes stop_codon:yes gene_type:complete
MSTKSDKIKEIIKGERAAVETYGQVFEKYGADSQIDKLRYFSKDHKEAVMELNNIARQNNIEIPESSGAWGSWSKLVTGTAKMLGEKSALKALKEGEEHGLKEYEDLLSSSSVPTQLKTMVQDKFIPMQRKHIQDIDSLMSRVS